MRPHTRSPRLSHLLALSLLLAACAAPQPGTTTDDELLYLGRDPSHPMRTQFLVRGERFTVFPGVFQPAPDSLHLLRHTHIRAGESVLDMGTGAGIQAVFAARRARRVVATDINPVAADNARLNAQLHGLSDKIEVRTGDLFAAIAPGERFDVVILFNIEYPNSDRDLALWEVHERFFAQVRRYLEPGGRIYYQTGFAHNLPRLFDMLARNRLHIVTRFSGPAVLNGEQYLTFEIRPLP